MLILTNAVTIRTATVPARSGRRAPRSGQRVRTDVARSSIRAVLPGACSSLGGLRRTRKRLASDPAPEPKTVPGEIPAACRGVSGRPAVRAPPPSAGTGDRDQPAAAIRVRARRSVPIIPLPPGGDRRPARCPCPSPLAGGTPRASDRETSDGSGRRLRPDRGLGSARRAAWEPPGPPVPISSVGGRPGPRRSSAWARG